jgi:hypothetical protein
MDPMIATMPMQHSNDAWQVLQLGGGYLVRAGMVMRVDRMFSPDASLVWKYTLTFRPVIRVHRNDSSANTTSGVDTDNTPPVAGLTSRSGGGNARGADLLNGPGRRSS